MRPFSRRASTVEMSASEAASEAQKGQLTLVDVREASERRAVAPGVPSVHLPLGELRGRLGELDASRPVAFICAAGSRSAKATRLAQDAGLDARNVTGGMAAWVSAGLTTRTGA